MTQQQYLTNLLGLQSAIEIMILEADETVYLTNQEVCELLNISPATLSRLSKQHKIKDPKIKGHRAYVKAKILELKESKEISKIQFKES